MFTPAGPQPLTVVSTVSLLGDWTLTVTTLTLPTSALSSFSISAGSTLTAISMSQDPAWDWTIDGGLDLQSSVRARNVVIRGRVTTPGVTASGNLTLLSGAWASHPIGYLPGLTLEVGGDLSIQAGALINVASRGYQGVLTNVKGLGPGGSFGAFDTGGAGHGGLGGSAVCNSPSAGGPSYGSLEDPRLPGSSAGGSGGTNRGPAGGGVLIAVVTDTLTLDGTIDASGGTDGNNSGGGSGGSVNLRANLVQGTGLIRVDGGDGRQIGGGGGSGGRAALWGAGARDTAVTFSAAGGLGGLCPAVGGGFSSWGQAGAGGTIYLRDPSFATHSLQVGGPKFFDKGRAQTPFPEGLSVDRLTIIDAFVAAAGALVTIASHADLRSGYFISASTLQLPVGLTSFTVPAGSGIEVLALLPSGLDWRVDGLLGVNSLEAHNISGNGTLALSSASLSGVFFEQPDRTQPTTTLLVQGDHFVDAAGLAFASARSRIAFDAEDPATGSAAPSGVDFTEYRLDKAESYTRFEAPFGLAEGDRRLDFRSRDKAGNLETARSSRIAVDVSAPISTLAIGTPSLALASSTLVNPSTLIGFSADDPVVATVASGVERVEAGLDEAPLASVTTTFTLHEGRHLLSFRAIDRVNNAETAKTAFVDSDGTAPSTSLQASGSLLESEGKTFASVAFEYRLAAEDPIVAGVSAGSAFTRGRLDAGAFALSTAPFFLAEGIRLVEFQSQDRVENLELLQAATIYVDGTSPVTRLESDGEFFLAEGKRFAAAGVAYRLEAEDPMAAGVSAGLAYSRGKVDGAAFSFSTSPFTLAEGIRLVEFQSQDRVENLESLRSETIHVDATPPMTSLSPSGPFFEAEGKSYAPGGFTYRLETEDPVVAGVAAGTAFSRGRVDGGAFALSTAPFSLAEGVRLVEFQSQDAVGNAELLRSATVHVDATAPETIIAVGQPSWPLGGTVLVSTATPIVLAATDSLTAGVASGVRETRFRLQPGVYSVYEGPIKLTPGAADWALEFFSSDRVANDEPVRSAAIRLDAIAPAVAIVSPAAFGICSVVEGVVPVLGSVSDAHLSEFRLEVAPGRDATLGFVLVSSGSVPPGALLGRWNASSSVGWHTLRLSAVDRVDNRAATQASVFVGKPAVSLVIGSPETFDLPEAVAVGPDGKVYVADTNADRIAIFSPSGDPLGELGSRAKKSSARLNKPRAVAVDAANRVYVADTNNDRVVRFTGSGVDLTVGGLSKPEGVAVGVDGRIYVSDTKRRRIAVFSSTGTALASHSLVVRTRQRDQRDGDDDDRHDDDDDSGAERPAGLAVDSAGNIYVADPSGSRVLRLDPQGDVTLALSLGGGKSEPHGVAVSPDGACLAASDWKLSKIGLFNREGAPLLVFGEKGKPRNPAKLAFAKPSGLALGPDGSLWIADRNNGRVVKLSAPTGASTVLAAAPGDPNSAREIVDREDGAEVFRSDKAGVVIPAQALAEDLRITVAKADDREQRDRDEASLRQKLTPASPPIEFGPHGTNFDKPVTLVLPMLAKAGPGAKVYYWNPGVAEWQPLESTLDGPGRLATAQTTHFSVYQVMAEGPALQPAAAADATFWLRSAYVFPNPARGSEKPTVHLAVGLADKVVWRVYDVSGREVHRSTLGQAAVIDEGSGPQYAYEQKWEGRMPSGVYFYQIEAERSGSAPIRASGKFAVIR